MNKKILKSFIKRSLNKQRYNVEMHTLKNDLNPLVQSNKYDQVEDVLRDFIDKWLFDSRESVLGDFFQDILDWRLTKDNAFKKLIFRLGRENRTLGLIFKH